MAQTKLKLGGAHAPSAPPPPPPPPSGSYAYVRYPAAEYATQKPDGNLTRLSTPCVRVWPGRITMLAINESFPMQSYRKVGCASLCWYRLVAVGLHRHAWLLICGRRLLPERISGCKENFADGTLELL